MPICISNIIILLVLNQFIESIEDEEENGEYQGKFIGSLNSFHHQVSGKVYAVDEYTFLLSGFNYDGNGADTFFWAGARYVSEFKF